MRCSHCGRENPPGAKFCDRCGSDLRIRPPEEAESRIRKKRIRWIPLLGIFAAAAAILLAVLMIRPGQRGQDGNTLGTEKTESAKTRGPSQEPKPSSTETPARTPAATEAEEPVPTAAPAETPKPTEEPEPTALPNETPEREAEPMSSEELEAEIQEIRDLYYGIQYDLDSLSPESPGAGLTAYRNEKGQLRKISAKKGAYGDSLSGTYSAEYYYETDPETGTPRCRFVFVFGAGEEYRIYLTEDFRCLRYIGPDGVTVDYPVPEASLDQVTEMYPFCLYAREAVS